LSADPEPIPELLILPDWSRLGIWVEGEALSPETAAPQRRVLDMRRGVLLREGAARTPNGYLTAIRTLQLASLAYRRLLLQGVEACPMNSSGAVRVELILSGEPRGGHGPSHFASFSASCASLGPAGAASGASSPTLVGRTRGGLVAALASCITVPP